MAGKPDRIACNRMRSGRRTRPIVIGTALATLALAVIAAFALPARGDDVVGNPGSVTFTSSSATMDINGNVFDLSDPISIGGTVAADGSVVVPQSSISFPSVAYSAPVVGALTINTVATGDGTGTVDPATGEVTFTFGIEVRIPKLTNNCKIGPITVNLTSGTDGGLTGIAYNEADGSATLVNNTMAVPGASGCKYLFVNVNGTINGELGLPASAGDSALTAALTANPIIVAPVTAPTASMTATPTSGPAPLDVSFDGSASSDPDGTLDSYAWDFGDGNTASGATATHTYATPGTYTAGLTVTDNDANTASTTETITVGEPLNAAPAAALAATPTTGVRPLDVSVDGSASSDTDGTIADYVWDFGDGNTATGITAAHTYMTAGNYTMSLTVTDDDGATDTSTQEIVVSDPANQTPSAVLNAAPLSGDAPLTVTADGSASTDADGYVAGYAWDFGDGNTATGTPVTNMYTAAGTYTLSLTATDDDGAQDTATTTVTVTEAPNSAPTAAIAPSVTSGDAPLAVSFSGAGSADSDGSIAAYAWDFGDGNTDSGASVSHTYAAAGTYTATLTVTDDDGDSAAATVSIVAAAPISPSVVGYPEAIALDEPGDSGDNGPGEQPQISYWINHASNVTVTGMKADIDLDGDDDTAGATATPVTPDTVPGGFTYSRVVTSFDVSSPDLGCLAWENREVTEPVRARFVLSDGSETNTVSVDQIFVSDDNCIPGIENPAFIYSQSQTATEAGLGESVDFTFRPYDPDCNEVDGYRWRARRLGDGTTTSTSSTIATSEDAWTTLSGVTFSERGRWVVEAQVSTDDGGGFWSGCGGDTGYLHTNLWYRLGTVDVNTVASASPTISLSGSPASTTIGDTFAVTAAVADTDYDGEVQMIEWDLDGNASNGALGDGYEVREFGSPTDGLSAAQLTKTVSTSGMGEGPLSVRARITDNGAYNGADPIRRTADDASVTTLVAGNQAPVVDAQATPTAGNAPHTVAFDGSGSSDIDGTISSYAWDFGDGNTATGTTATNTYANAGVFVASLTVTDDDGDTAGSSVTIVVSPGNTAPTASFSSIGASGHAPLAIGFDATASADPDGVIVSYEWDFGDGATASGATTTHTFAEGTWTVTLTVTDNAGATALATEAVVADSPNQGPSAVIGADPTTGDYPLAVSVDGSGSTDPDGTITDYAWDFGDGNTAAGATASHTYTSEGTYTITLYVTDDDGEVGSAIQAITVNVPPNLPPTATFSANPTSGHAPLAVSVNGSASTDSDGTIADYAWDFGDGNTATGATAANTYASSGSYTLSLTVTDDGGASDTVTETINVDVENVAPTASFTTSTTSGEAPVTVEVDASASTDSDGTIADYAWDFGDGNTATGATATHTYASSGTYTLMLTVTDDDGATTSATETIEVTNPAGDLVTINVTGGYQYSNSNAATTGDFSIRRSGVAVASVSGSATIPSTVSGDATVSIGLRRFATTTLYMGRVTISDPAAGISLSTPIFFGKAFPAAGTNAVQGVVRWFKIAPGFQFKSYAVHWVIDDIV